MGVPAGTMMKLRKEFPPECFLKLFSNNDDIKFINMRPLIKEEVKDRGFNAVNENH